MAQFKKKRKNKMTRTFYEILGEESILKIAKKFYEGVAEDELMLAMYPKNLAPAEERFALFLVQVFGGPTTYSDQRGHPRLRKRHFPYTIDINAREHWMRHITNAVNEIEMDKEIRRQIMEYFERASLQMINKME